MATALDQLTGTIPVIVMGGVAMKMTQSMFDQQQKYNGNRRRVRSRRNGRRVSRLGFGDFSNLGIS